jgi:MerR family redox-sensitive transcriptional activator SoxR
VIIIRVEVNLRSSKLLDMTIGQVSKETGLAASAIRFYEQAGLLPKPTRIGGRRMYDSSILERLAVIERAKACGFSLTETRQLFYGFRESAPPSERWRTLARRKLAELEDLERKIAATRELLQRTCACTDLGECGRRIREKAGARTGCK